MTIKINNKDYSFKTAFNEFTIDEYLSMLKVSGSPVGERVSVYTGIPLEVLQSLPLENFAQICEAVSFIEQDNILSALSVQCELKDVGLESFGKLEKAKGLIKEDFVSALIPITELYTGEEIKGKPLLEVWLKVLHYMKSLPAFFEKFKRLNLHEYSDEELEADVEVLEAYKHYPIVFKYGKARGMKNDEVLELPAIEIYTELLYDYDSSEYEKRYGEVIRQRQEHFSKLK
jgi:hypothetical protein